MAPFFASSTLISMPKFSSSLRRESSISSQISLPMSLNKSLKDEIRITSPKRKNVVKRFCIRTKGPSACMTTTATKNKQPPHFWKLNHDLLNGDDNGGRLVHGGRINRQNIAVRSSEIGNDYKMSMVAVAKHLQDTQLNHLRNLGLSADGFGSTYKMSRNNLIWVLHTLQIEVDQYPSWTDVIQVDTWIYTSGKNRLNRDWLILDCKTGNTLIRATSVFVVMNKKTRKLSKFSREIKEAYEPYLMDCDSIINKVSQREVQFDVGTADNVCTGLRPGWFDIDVNQHVNNAKYFDWILKSVPCTIVEHHKLFGIAIEYRKECNEDSVLQSLCKITNSVTNNPVENDVVEIEHLISLEDGSEISRAKTVWKPKQLNGYQSKL